MSPTQTLDPQLIAPFAYPSAVPLNMAQVRVENLDGGAKVESITFSGAAGDTVEAYLIVPGGSGPFPGVLFEHGADGDREQLRAYGVAVAQNQHFVALVVSRPTTSRGTTALAVREIRRALDVLQSQPEVDRSKLGYVGISDGARLGIIMTAADNRLRAAVFMSAGGPDVSTFAPYATVPNSLFQFGTQDAYMTSVDDANALAALIPGQRKIVWYDAPHELNDQARADGAAWLGTALTNS